jgi:uroporphyrinogen decarboxylase
MEQAYEDLVVNPEIAAAALGRIFDFHYEYNRRIFEAGAGKIELMTLAEDLGGQIGPLFSLEHYRQFLLPNQTRMADLARNYGLRVFYHTDGAARAFLPDLVDSVGINILNPIQWRCPGMEIPGLVRDFGAAVVFHGSIDNQRTLPFGTVDDVVNEVRTNARLFAGARWICAPCHNIQAVTPTRNVIAMYEAAKEIRLAA